jgi:hypothetical protein
MNNIIDTTSTDTTRPLPTWAAPAETPVEEPAEDKTDAMTLTLGVAAVLPVDTGGEENIALALMLDGSVRWVKLPDDEDV